MNTITQYASYVRPEWAPPAWLFAPVWTFLYIIIIISFGFIYSEYSKGKIDFNMTIPFTLNLFFNLAYTPIQFGLQNNVLATLDILLVLTTLIWLMLEIWRKYKWVAIANTPYLLWVSFATVLQITITYLNR